MLCALEGLHVYFPRPQEHACFPWFTCLIPVVYTYIIIYIYTYTYTYTV